MLEDSIACIDEGNGYGNLLGCQIFPSDNIVKRFNEYVELEGADKLLDNFDNTWKRGDAICYTFVKRNDVMKLLQIIHKNVNALDLTYKIY